MNFKQNLKNRLLKTLSTRPLLFKKNSRIMVVVQNALSNPHVNIINHQKRYLSLLRKLKLCHSLILKMYHTWGLYFQGRMVALLELELILQASSTFLSQHSKKIRLHRRNSLLAAEEPCKQMVLK
jgi:hypothetical protein